jgi:hypothetical protein
VATGRVRAAARGGISPQGSVLPIPAWSPSHDPERVPEGKVSLRPVKQFVRSLEPAHPLRVVVISEPDEMDRSEYLIKLAVWLRLLPIG